MSNADKIRSINAPGWDGVNAEAAVPLQNINVMREMDQTFKRCFDSAAGKKVLSHLAAQTLDQPCWTPGADTSYGYAREGQNSIVREIIQRIKRANELG